MTATEHTDALLEALRRNLHILNELAVRYEVETDPGRADGGPAITSPEDVGRLLGAEMGALCQEQVRVLPARPPQPRRRPARHLPGERLCAA